MARKPKQKTEKAEARKTFLDMIAPGVIRFGVSDFICGNTYRCVWALREYPASTEEQAILRHLGEMAGVTLHIYTRRVSAVEEERIIQSAQNRNRMVRMSSHNVTKVVEAEANLEDVRTLLGSLHRSRESLLHCAVFVELCAEDEESFRHLKSKVDIELRRAKLNVDLLRLRQKEGFQAASPVGRNVFGPEFERVLPAGSVANLYPFNYSGKTDRCGFYLGKDRYGSSVVVDFDQRDEDKTNANVLILGSSGMGKSYLLKLILLNCLEAGKSVISLDTEHELGELCRAMGGCFVDVVDGSSRINLLEPRCWDTDGGTEADGSAPEAFRRTTRLSQHISFLRDIFRSYKDFTTAQLDTIELMLARLYASWGISDDTDFSALSPEEYPTLSAFYAFLEQQYSACGETALRIYTRPTLQQVLLGLHAMCKGADAKFFDGHTNVVSRRFLVFGVKSLDNVSENVRRTILLNLLSYMTDKLLVEGNTVAVLDELYKWLGNPVAVEYIRNAMKRVRKKDSAMVLASQNLEDFDQPGIREMTKPLFAIPPHQFLFNPGTIPAASFMDMLQLESSEFQLIREPHRGVCLYKCGSERYLLEVHAPPYKQALFGKEGGR